MLSLISDIFLTSFHRPWISRASVPPSFALCMPPFNIYNPYKSFFFFISFWAWLRLQAARWYRTSFCYHGFQDPNLCFPLEIIYIPVEIDSLGHSFKVCSWKTFILSVKPSSESLPITYYVQHWITLCPVSIN